MMDEIRKRYPKAGDAELRDEIWSALRERNSPAMERAIKTLQGKVWYNRAWAAFKDAWKGILSRMGFNRADLSKIDKMSNDEFLDFLDRTMAEGKTIGRLEKGGAEGVREMSKVGVRNDGIEVYESDEDVRKLPYNERVKRFVDLMRNEYAGRTARFVKDGQIYYATFDKGGIDKNIHGDTQSDKRGYKAKINAGASGDVFDLVENARYDHTSTETGKDSPMHRGVKSWDYFDKTVQVDGRAFDVLVNVRDKGNNQFVYNVALVENKNIKPASSRDARSALSWEDPGSTRSSIADSDVERKGESEENSSPVRQSRAPKPSGYKILDDVQSKVEKAKEKLVDRYASVQSVQDDVGGVKEIVGPDGYTDHTKSTDFVAAADKENGRIEYETRELGHRSAEIDKDLAEAGFVGDGPHDRLNNQRSVWSGHKMKG